MTLKRILHRASGCEQETSRNPDILLDWLIEEKRSMCQTVSMVESRHPSNGLLISICALVLGIWVGSYGVMRFTWTHSLTIGGKTGTARIPRDAAKPASPPGTGTARRANLPSGLVILPVSGSPGDAAAQAANILYYPLRCVDRALWGTRASFSRR